MAWSLVWSDGAARTIRKLDPPIAKRIITKMESTLEDPPRFLERLVGEDEWRLRVGDHRVLCLLSFDVEAVLVTAVGHRSSVYGGEA